MFFFRMELRYVGSNDHLIRVKLGSFTFDVTLNKISFIQPNLSR